MSLTATSTPRRKAAPRPAGPDYRESSMIFRLLGDATRLRLLALMAASGPDGISVTDLCAVVGMSQPAVSHNLTPLRHARIVRCRRDGKRNLYTIAPGGELAGAMGVLAAIVGGAGPDGA